MSRDKRRPAPWILSRGAVAAALQYAMASGLAPGAAVAKTIFDPYASITLEHDSNLFAVPDQNAVIDSAGVPSLSDTLTEYKAGFRAFWLFDRQRISAYLEGRELTYDKFSDLNHSEYNAEMNLDWKLGSIFDGVLLGQQQRQIVSFADRTTSQLTIQVDQIVRGTFNVAVTPVWRLETNGSIHNLSSPIQFSPDFALREVSSGFGIKYVGVADLSFGLEGEHVDGKFSGISAVLVNDDVLNYKQNSAQFALNYAITGLDRINAAVGYTARDLQGVSQTVAGVTGAFGYQRQLTGKTTVNAQFTRAINSYFNAGSSEIDTGGSAGATWQATPKLNVALNYQRTHSVFEGQTLFNTITLGRTDNLSFYSLEINYHPLKWLIVRPYLRRQTRASDLAGFTYSGNIAGIEIRYDELKPDR